MHHGVSLNRLDLRQFAHASSNGLVSANCCGLMSSPPPSTTGSLTSSAPLSSVSLSIICCFSGERTLSISGAAARRVRCVRLLRGVDRERGVSIALLGRIHRKLRVNTGAGGGECARLYAATPVMYREAARPSPWEPSDDCETLCETPRGTQSAVRRIVLA